MNFSRLLVHNFNGDFLKSTFCDLLSLCTQRFNYLLAYIVHHQSSTDLENNIVGPGAIVFATEEGRWTVVGDALTGVYGIGRKILTIVAIPQ